MAFKFLKCNVLFKKTVKTKVCTVVAHHKHILKNHNRYSIILNRENINFVQKI